MIGMRCASLAQRPADDTPMYDSSSVPIPPGKSWDEDPFCLTAIDTFYREGGCSIRMTNLAGYDRFGALPLGIWYSYDLQDWHRITLNATEIYLVKGQRVWFKAGPAGNAALNDMQDRGWTFTTSGSVAASGNIMSLLGRDDDLEPCSFMNLFYNCRLVGPAPRLPAMNLAQWCYKWMFAGTEISSAVLPATKLVDDCYAYMFEDSKIEHIRVGFSSWDGNLGMGNSVFTAGWMITAAGRSGTFQCPAALGNDSTIVRGDSNCPQGWTVDNSVHYEEYYGDEVFVMAMEDGVTVEMVERKYTGAEDPDPDGSSSSSSSSPLPPPGDAEIQYSTNGYVWNDLDIGNMSGAGAQIQLAAGKKAWFRAKSANRRIGARFAIQGKCTVGGDLSYLTGDARMAAGCFAGLFSNNIGILCASEVRLNSLELSSSCYESMFDGCSSLVYAPMNLPALSLMPRCYAAMFKGCSHLTVAPGAIPATTLASGCCYEMFRGCTSLVRAPSLSAPVLVNVCYARMFYGCAKLSYMSVGFTEWNHDDAATFQWVQDVPTGGHFSCLSSGSFDDDSSELPEEYGVSSWPEGWTMDGTADPGIPEDLYFSAEEDGVAVSLSGGSEAPMLLSSADGVHWFPFLNPGYDDKKSTSWNLFLSGKDIAYIPGRGDKIYFRGFPGNSFYEGSGNDWRFHVDAFDLRDVSDKNAYSDSASVGGWLSSLIGHSEMPDYCFSYLFAYCNISYAANITLSSTLSPGCYQNLFRNSRIKTAPLLPAEILAEGCYTGMFGGCDWLGGPIELPAKTLVQSCYASMFYGCDVLSAVKVGFSSWTGEHGEASVACADWFGGRDHDSRCGVFYCPEALAQNIGERGDDRCPECWSVSVYKLNGYHGELFFVAQEDGTQITMSGSGTEPSLLYSTDLENWHDFGPVDTGEGIGWTTIELEKAGDGVYIKGAPGNGKISEGNATWSFVIDKKCAVSGDVSTLVPGLNRNNPASYCFRGLFRDCPITSAPSLPYDKLWTGCYESMFQRCTHLGSAPALNFGRCAPHCCAFMFDGCTSLAYLPGTALPPNTASYCYLSMFQGCVGLGRAPSLPSTSLSRGCYQSMFNGCETLQQMPDLPAVSLAQECYRGMFSGCDSLRQTAILPAHETSSYCYMEMFKDCSNLKIISVYLGPSGWNKDGTTDWVSGVNRIGEFWCSPRLYEAFGKSWTYGDSECPYNFKVYQFAVPAPNNVYVDPSPGLIEGSGGTVVHTLRRWAGPNGWYWAYLPRLSHYP